MFKKNKILAIIPARKGSKRIPNKNLKKFNGKPLIYWSIKAAHESKYIDKVIVSTDSKLIREISIKHGSDVPFLRPKEISTSTSKSSDVIIHALNNINGYDYIIYLQPTSPLRDKKDIDDSIKLGVNNNVKSLASFSHSLHHDPNIIFEFDKNKKKIKKTNFSKSENKRSSYYVLNGAIFLLKASWFKDNKKFIYKGTFPFIMDQKKSVDIDNSYDFEIAEYLMKKNNT